MAEGDVYQMTRTVLIDGQTHVNVLHFMESGYVGLEPEQDLLLAWDPPLAPEFPTSPEDRYQALQRGFSTFTQVSLSAKRVFPTEGETFARGFNRVKSTATDSGLPTLCQMKFLLSTDLISRSGRGGFYMGGIAESQTVGNTINGTTLLGNITQFLDALIAVHTAGGAAFAGFVVGVFSRLLLEFNAATVIGYSTTVGSMVSRRAGRGS